MKLHVFVDGAAAGNPGPAGIGVVIVGDNGTPLLQCGEPIGTATNNVAEYYALLRALEVLPNLDVQVESVTICSDSQLLVQQLTGSYRVRAQHLLSLWEEARRRLRELQVPVRIEHIPREDNYEADRLARIGARMSQRQYAKGNESSSLCQQSRGTWAAAGVRTLIPEESPNSAEQRAG